MNFIYLKQKYKHTVPQRMLCMAFQIPQIVPYLHVRKVNDVEYEIGMHKLVEIAISNPKNLYFNSFHLSLAFIFFTIKTFYKLFHFKREKK